MLFAAPFVIAAATLKLDYRPPAGGENLLMMRELSAGQRLGLEQL